MRVHSTKFDGSLHYRYEVQLVAWRPAMLALYLAAGTPLDSYRGRFPSRRHRLLLHWADRSYNLEVMWEEDWQPHAHYVNVATPSVWDDEVVRFVDLDLDVIWQAANNAIILDDADEFAEHQISYRYPPELVDQAWSTVHEVRQLFTAAVPPFDGRLYAWRPSATRGARLTPARRVREERV